MSDVEAESWQDTWLKNDFSLAQHYGLCQCVLCWTWDSKRDLSYILLESYDSLVMDTFYHAIQVNFREVWTEYKKTLIFNPQILLNYLPPDQSLWESFLKKQR